VCVCVRERERERERAREKEREKECVRERKMRRVNDLNARTLTHVCVCVFVCERVSVFE